MRMLRWRGLVNHCSLVWCIQPSQAFAQSGTASSRVLVQRGTQQCHSCGRCQRVASEDGGRCDGNHSVAGGRGDAAKQRCNAPKDVVVISIMDARFFFHIPAASWRCTVHHRLAQLSPSLHHVGRPSSMGWTPPLARVFASGTAHAVPLGNASSLLIERREQ